MWDKINEIRKKYPIPFWVAIVVVFPIGIFVAVRLLMGSGNVPTSDSSLQKAAVHEGKADILTEQNKEIEKTTQMQKKVVEERQEMVKKVFKKLEDQKKQADTDTQNIQKDDSWDTLCTRGGIADEE